MLSVPQFWAMIIPANEGFYSKAGLTEIISNIQNIQGNFQICFFSLCAFHKLVNDTELHRWVCFNMFESFPSLFVFGFSL